MPDSPWKAKKTWDDIFSGKPSKKAPIEARLTRLYPKGEDKYDIEANNGEGLIVFFKDAIATAPDYDAQSEADDTLTDWIDAQIDEDEGISAALGVAPSSDEVIRNIESASGNTRRQAIFDAEAMAFHGDERVRLNGLLKTYIEQHRDSKDREELIAVSAAIRKYIALINEEDMAWLATLLESGHRAQPSLDAELEIAKMVIRRYSQSPPTDADPHPDLSNRLVEIAYDYLRPRVFARDRFSTVAMLAIQALMVMRSEHVETAISEVNKLPYAWFRQQLIRRMNKILLQMSDDAPGIEALRELIGKINAE